MDIEAKLNVEGYNLINLLESELSSERASSDKIDKYIGIKVMELNMPVETDGVFHELDSFSNTISAKKKIKGTEVGINSHNYTNLKDLANKIIELEYFNNFTDFEFIERCIFEWVIDIHENQYAKSDLINYLKNAVENQLHNYPYYYKVFSLGIEDEFMIGNVNFTSLTESFFENEFKNINEKAYENDNDPVKKISAEYIDRVIASTHAYATKNKATKKSLYETELAINLLKCFMPDESVNSTLLPHINERDSSIYFSFLSRSKTDNNLTFQLINKGQTALISSERMQIFKANGLDTFSEFIKINPKSELQKIIFIKINSLGEINSTTNFYERSTKLISFFESFLIPEGNTKGNGQGYLKQVVKKITADEDLVKIVTEIYDIRDKYLHNRIEKNIKQMSFFKLQVFALSFIRNLIDVSQEFKTRTEVLESLGISNKLKK